MRVDLPPDWHEVLQDQLSAPYFRQLQEFVDAERRTQRVFPAEADVFRAFRLTPYSRTRVLLLGQDPYHGDGQAHGLCFSVPAGIAAPPSLKNMFKELEADLGKPAPGSGDLSSWAQQGVLMLNAVLTVRAGQAASHKSRGWENFTDAVISALVRRHEPVVFVLWGNYARKKAKLIRQQTSEASRGPVLTEPVLIEGVHPSPLSASRGFFGSKPFSAINAALAGLQSEPIDWTSPSGSL